MDSLPKRYIPPSGRVMKEMIEKDLDIYLMEVIKLNIQICSKTCINNFSTLVSNDEKNCLNKCFYKALEMNQYIDGHRNYIRPD